MAKAFIFLFGLAICGAICFAEFLIFSLSFIK
jgi:hypothetical protein